MNPLRILRESGYFFSHNLGRICLLCLPLLLAEALVRQQFGGWLDAQVSQAGELLPTLIFYPLYAATLILFLDCRSNAQPVEPSELLGQALRLWPRFAILTALSSLLILLGASLLILPGIWVMLRLVFAEYLLVLQGLSPLAAIQQSFRLSSGYFWPITACLLSVMPLFWLLDWWSYQQLGEQPDAQALVLWDAGNGFLQLFISVVGYRMFVLRTATTQPHSSTPG